MADEPPANEPQPPAESDFRPAPAPSSPPPQFSLGEFMLWIAIMSIGLSGLAWITPPIFAGACGLLALAAMIITVVWNPQAPMFQLVWYALLFMYLIALIIAFLAPRHAAH